MMKGSLTVYVLIEESGDYDERSERTIAYFADPDEAMDAAEVFRSNFRSYTYVVEELVKATEAVVYWEAVANYDRKANAIMVGEVQSLVGVGAPFELPSGYVLGYSGYGYGKTSWEALEKAFWLLQDFV